MLLATAKEMLHKGLVEGTAGNLAARLPDGNVVLTPSSLPYESMTLEDLVVCDLDGNVLEGTRGPTTEKALHLTVLREHDDVHATIHSHAMYATMFAVTRTTIPAVIEEFVVFVGGDVGCAEYRTTGTDELAVEVAKHLDRPQRRPHGEPRLVHRGQGPAARDARRRARRADRADHLGRAADRRGDAHPRRGQPRPSPATTATAAPASSAARVRRSMLDPSRRCFVPEIETMPRAQIESCARRSCSATSCPGPTSGRG